MRGLLFKERETVDAVKFNSFARYDMVIFLSRSAIVYTINLMGEVTNSEANVKFKSYHNFNKLFHFNIS